MSENDFIKKLDFDGDTFETMKKDMNFVLQRLLGNMVEYGTTDGTMTVKIDIHFKKEFIPNYDPNIEGESREISKPDFDHKITSSVKINDEKKGTLDTEMELYFNEETGSYEMKPVANTSQRSIFDADFKEVNVPEEEKDENIVEGTAIEGTEQPALPGPSDEDVTEEIFNDGNDEDNTEELDFEEPEDDF